MQTVIYARISQDSTGTGLGVARQEKECRELADRLGWTVADVFVDNDLSASGKVKRPKYLELLAGLSSGRWGALVTYAQDRLTRSPRELEDLIDALEKGGTQVASVTGSNLDLSTPAGRAVARIVGALARAESEQKSARQKSKARELAEAGKPSGGGGRPYGFEDDRITHRAEEAALLRAAVADILAGTGSVRVWAERCGMSRTGFRRALVSPRVAGLRTHNGKFFPAVWEPIISADDRLRLVAFFGSGQEAPAPGRYLLSGCLECMVCGDTMLSEWFKRPNGQRVRRYSCRRWHNGILADAIEETAEGFFRRDWAQHGTVEESVTEADLGALEAIEGRRTELAEMFASGEIGRAEWAAARSALDKRAEVASVGGTVVRSWSPLEAWEGRTAEERNAVLRRLGFRLVVIPGTKASRRPGLERVAYATWRPHTADILR